jgi:hypothetical protein
MNLVETVLALQEGWIALNESVESLEQSNAELTELARRMREQGEEARSQAQRFEQANTQLEVADQERTREVRLIVNRVAEHYSAVVAAADRTDKLATMVTESLVRAQQYQLAAQHDRKSTEEQAAQIMRTGLEIATASADVKVVRDAVVNMREHIAQERKQFERVVAEVTKDKIADLGLRLRSEIDEHVTRALQRLTETKVKAFRWRGPWAEKETYDEGDIFTLGGNTYIVLRRSIGVPPRPGELAGKSPRYGLMATAGAPGRDGIDASFTLGPANQESISLTSNVTLGVGVKNVQLITPNSDSWEITIPDGMTNGGWVWLRNESLTFNFIVKNAGGTTLATIDANGFGVFSN